MLDVSLIIIIESTVDRSFANNHKFSFNFNY